MKTIFVLYMLTLMNGHSPQVTVLDTFISASDCYDTVNELQKFYTLRRMSDYNSGLMTFRCIEKKVVKDGRRIKALEDRLDGKNPD